MPDIDISITGNRFADIIFRYPCTQKILMVTDSSLSFGTDGFGLSEFVGIVRAAGHTVTTAHRSGSGPNLTIAGAYNFATATPAVTTANYDQIWLFGFSVAPLTAAEQTRIAQFMAAGGGVFATGDHETIGAGMGSNLPRVRSMRNWATIPMVNPSRHDTVIDPGADGVKQFNDQADATPQRIYPVFFSNGGADNVPGSWSVHPVLRHSSGAVDNLPDHPHESECLAPAPVAGSFAGIEEWPLPVSGGARVGAQIAAVSVSAGRFIVDTLKPPVRPRCFGAISAYDGDPARVGRVVCDATWHHFVNINLNGSGAGNDPTTGLPRTGLYAAGTPTPEYMKIRAYYLNTVRWLAPIGRRTCWPFVIATLARFDFEMQEFRLPLPHPCPWDPLLRIGLLAEEIVNRQWGPGTLADVVDDMLTTSEAAPALGQLLKGQQAPQGAAQDKREPSLLPLQDLRRVILGAVVNTIAHKLPEDDEKLAAVLKRSNDKLARELVLEGVGAAQQAIDEYLQQALKQTAALVKAIQRKK